MRHKITNKQGSARGAKRRDKIENLNRDNMHQELSLDFFLEFLKIDYKKRGNQC